MFSGINNGEDVNLLILKIHVLSTLQSHANVVKYLGKVEPDDQEGKLFTVQRSLVLTLQLINH